jgi:hypothetical protein
MTKKKKKKKKKNKEAHAINLYIDDQLKMSEKVAVIAHHEAGHYAYELWGISEQRKLLVHGNGSSPKRISKPPGFLLRSLADTLFSSNTMKGVIEPSIADMQHEYFEALNSNQKFKAFCVRCRGYVSILMTLGVYRIVKLLWDVWQNTLAK